jgi:hypothetical protein
MARYLCGDSGETIALSPPKIHSAPFHQAAPLQNPQRT